MSKAFVCLALIVSGTIVAIGTGYPELSMLIFVGALFCSFLLFTD